MIHTTNHTSDRFLKSDTPYSQGFEERRIIIKSPTYGAELQINGCIVGTL